MDKEQLTKDYNFYNEEFLEFQNEVFYFLEKLKLDRKKTIDIFSVEPRKSEDGKVCIKKLNSVANKMNKAMNAGKKYISLLDIKDVAGTRITCHCESDRGKLFDILMGELKKKYKKVESSEKSGLYVASHFNVSKEIIKNGKGEEIWCEIQVRTVMSNAWAIQDHKYRYKDEDEEGEPMIIATSISNVMNGLEGLWDMLKDRHHEEIKEMKAEKLKQNEEKIRETKSPDRHVIKKPSIDKGAWLTNVQKEASTQFKKTSYSAYMEIKLSLENEEKTFDSNKLLDAAEKSQIHTFGWPLGVMMRGNAQYDPKPKNEGICVCPENTNTETGFDYWTLRNDGTFYLLKSLFEDERSKDEPKIFFNTRIIRISEALLYASNLYKNLGLNQETKIEISITHVGLDGRKLWAAGNRSWTMHANRIARENNVQTTIATTIGDIEDNLADNVELFTKPLFEKFDFFSLDRGVLDDIVTRYKNGEVS